MEIWQGVTSIGSATWGSFAGIQIYANLDNSFTIASSGNLDGSGSTDRNVLAAQVSAFGISAPNALQQFMVNLPLLGNQPLTYDQFSSYDIERLSNGNWAVALVLDETTTVYPHDNIFVMMEFDQNLQSVNIQNYGTFNGVNVDVEVTNLTSGFYNLTFDYGGFGNLPTQIHSATSQAGNLPNGSANNFYSSPNGGVVRDTEVFWDNTIGGARQVWIEDSAGIHSIRTATIDANGNLTSGPSTLWTGLPDDTAFELAVLKGSSRSYVLWNHNVSNAAEGDLDLMITGGPGGGTTTISIPDLLGLTSSQYFIHQMTELANGNIAILYQPNAVSEKHHLLILTSTGVLVEDYAIASFIPVYNYGDLTMTELRDGRIAIAARETTNITGPNDLVHLILDPRADTIFGTAGDDFILGKTNKAETIFAGEGNDTLHTMTGGGFLYGEGGDDQLFGDAGNDFFSGGNDNDLIFGRGGNDEIHGGAGADSIAGEDGSDMIFGDGGRDGISGGIGIDTIHGGDEGDTISGNDDADFLYGDAGADDINGDAGDDDLAGGTENDLLKGGDGNDYLFGDDGEDTLLGGIDNDHLFGGTGNDILNGEDGTDFLRGGAGNDTVNAGAGIDLIYGDAGIDNIDGGADQDTVTFVESTAGVEVNMGAPGSNTGDAAGDTYANVEIFRLSNFDDIFYGSSNSSVFSVYGGAGNDQIWGRGPLADPFLNPGMNMEGGDGTDIFVLNRGGNTVRGDDVGGTQNLDVLVLGLSNFGLTINMATATTADTTYSFLFAGQTQTVYGDVEAIFATHLADNITGNVFDNYLQGGAGADTLNGGGQQAKGDTLSYEGSAAAVAVNISTNTASGGDATGDVISNFENVSGSDFNDNLTGTAAVNTLIGNSGSDMLNGGAGGDTLDGGTNTAAGDTLSYTGSTVGVQVNLTTNTAAGGDAAGDLISNFENVTGSALVDNLTGNNGDNTLIGGAGGDTLDGSANTAAGDTLSYAGSTAGVQVNLSTNTAAGGDAAGDVISNFENVTGSALVDNLTGNAGANVLNGGIDAVSDTLAGGLGNDTYIINTSSDLITEFVAGGTADVVQASVSFTLANDDYIETLQTTNAALLTAINLTGNALRQVITGNAGVNILNGGVDVVADTLVGGLGNDTYIINTSSDLITEFVAGGKADVVQASVSFTLANDDYIEIMQTTDAALLTAINLTGNAIRQVITGNAGVNILNGGVDVVSDTLAGGLGDDTYIINTSSDLITEFVAGGTADVVQASVSFTLANDDYIETMQTTNAALTTAINLTGNALRQTISGNAGANILNGMFGNDTLTGGLGADTFLFNSTLNAASNRDTITDFDVVADTIQLENTGIFTALGVLDVTMFKNLTTGGAVDADDRILYDDVTGALSYDADGNGIIAAIQFATLTGAPTVTNVDFFVV